jgi:4-hydroxybenzoate polyprenyltransferase
MAKKDALPYLLMLRPYQWSKNLLLFSSLIFSTSLFVRNDLILSILAFGIFCITSSGIYILNDLRDIERDRLNPTKKNRPLAAGKIPKSKAIIIMMFLLSISVMFSILLDKNFFIIILTYLCLNFAYSFGLKNIVILDAMIVAFGFFLRVFAGCVIIKVEVTPWLFICTLSLALTLSFGKRRNELNELKFAAKNFRGTLELYTPQLLDVILTICSATAVITYSLYTMANETVQRFGNQRLILTMPFVLYGVFRYLYLIYTKNKGGDPTKLLLLDLPSILNGILWISSIIYLIYGNINLYL